jgi:hypothetical protein
MVVATQAIRCGLRRSNQRALWADHSQRLPVHSFGVTPCRVPGEFTCMLTERLDTAGGTTSVVCAIHCALSPLLLPLLPLTSRRLIGPTVEWGFVAIALMLGTVSLSHSFRVVHRDWRAIGLFIAGFAVLMSVRVLEPPGALEPLGVFGAALFIVAAHALNLRLGRRHATACACACHVDVTTTAQERAHTSAGHNAVLPT